MKNIKLYFILSVFFLFGFNKVNSIQSPGLVDVDYCLKDKNYSSEFIQKFKASTLVYFYSKLDEKNPEYLTYLKNYLPKVWTITPVIFAPDDEISKYINDDNYSCVTNQETIINTVSEPFNNANYRPRSTNYLFNKKLSFPFGNTKKGQTTFETLMYSRLMPRDKSTVITADLFTQKFTVVEPEQDTYYNYSPISICTQLQIICNNLLTKNMRSGYYTSVADGSLGQVIYKDTLYIPDYLLIKRKSLMNLKKEDNQEVMKNYPYKYKVCNVQELNKIFIEEKRGRLIADYISIPNDFLSFNIYDTKQGKLLYSQAVNSPMHFMLTEKDLKKMLKQAE